MDINFRECAIHSFCLFISLFIQLFFSSLLRKESIKSRVFYIRIATSNGIPTVVFIQAVPSN